jgi:ketosteroid isomerase-like protein
MIVRKNRLAAACGTITLFAMCAAFAADKPAPEDAVGDAWQKAVKANDLDAVVKLYAEDAVAWFPDEVEHRGSAAIRASYKDLFDANTVQDAALSDRHHEGDAKHRTNWGHFSLTLKQKSDGKVITMTGRYTDVQELRCGQWVYVVDHASAEPAPPKPAPPTK